MKFFTRVAFLFLAFALFPLSYSYAEDGSDDAEASSEKVLTLDETRELIDGLPTASDAVSGVVSTEGKEYYDIYGRQIAFRKSAQELRSSLDERRENFETPRVNAIEGYRGTVKKVYVAETAAYQDAVTNGSDDVAEVIEADESESDDASDEAEQPEEMADADDAQDEVVPGLTEKSIPSDSDEEGAPKKKVVMPDDAPEFDPANL